MTKTIKPSVLARKARRIIENTYYNGRLCMSHRIQTVGHRAFDDCFENGAKCSNSVFNLLLKYAAHNSYFLSKILIVKPFGAEYMAQFQEIKNALPDIRKGN
jgi:hypothetical protein